jgi:endonuclease YncB( thermonuclease family)
MIVRGGKWFPRISLNGMALFYGVLAGLLGLGIAATRTVWAEGAWEKVIRVDDGDTVQLLDGRRVRYIGIDSPERGEPGKGEFLAEEATRFNRALVLGREVRLELEAEERDRFGRLLAQVYLKDGLWVNQALVREGLAHVLYQAPNVDKFEELLDEQRGAMEKRRGIWIKALQETEAAYPGQRKTRKMHRPDCPLGRKISPANRVLFKTKREAYWLGYSPCRQCKP